MNRRRIVLLILLCGLGCGCARKPEGVVEVRIPGGGIRSLAWVSLRGIANRPAVWTASNLSEVVSARLPVGQYRVLLGFANSNYQPPTEVEAGRIAVAAATTNVFACGLVAFHVRPDLPDLNLSAVIVRGRSGGPAVELRGNGNTYYFFLPKPLPSGLYDVDIRYYRSAAPSVVATGIVVRAGETTTVALDSGMVLRPPRAGRVTGWSLTREGTGEPWLAVQRGHDNDEPLWRRFMVPPGTYRFAMVRDPASPASAPETLTVEAGRILVHTPGQ